MASYLCPVSSAASSKSCLSHGGTSEVRVRALKIYVPNRFGKSRAHKYVPFSTSTTTFCVTILLSFGQAKYFGRSTPMVLKICQPHDRYVRGDHTKFQLSKYRWSKVVTDQNRGYLCVESMQNTFLITKSG